MQLFSVELSYRSVWILWVNRTSNKRCYSVRMILFNWKTILSAHSIKVMSLHLCFLGTKILLLHPLVLSFPTFCLGAIWNCDSYFFQFSLHPTVIHFQWHWSRSFNVVLVDWNIENILNHSRYSRLETFSILRSVSKCRFQSLASKIYKPRLGRMSTMKWFFLRFGEG